MMCQGTHAALFARQEARPALQARPYQSIGLPERLTPCTASRGPHTRSRPRCTNPCRWTNRSAAWSSPEPRRCTSCSDGSSSARSARPFHPDAPPAPPPFRGGSSEGCSDRVHRCRSTRRRGSHAGCTRRGCTAGLPDRRAAPGPAWRPQPCPPGRPTRAHGPCAWRVFAGPPEASAPSLVQCSTLVDALAAAAHGPAQVRRVPGLLQRLECE